MQTQTFTLRAVLNSVKKTLADRYQSAYWIKAEMNKLNYHAQSGHCFPELVEKADGKTVAQVRAHLWADDFARINQTFIHHLGLPLGDGIKILFQARVTFDPIYGLSLRILQIDPAFTLGDLEREKQETWQWLTANGLALRNKNLNLPLLPLRIALISAENSKGYADFMRILSDHPKCYPFTILLFPAVLQGDQSAESMIHQLERIKRVAHHFDAVAIVRGGGGDVGLTCYNDRKLAQEICEYPLPVLTGIGHSTNETIAERVAHTNAITPTKLAEILLHSCTRVDDLLEHAQEAIGSYARMVLAESHQQLTQEGRYFRSVCETQMLRQQGFLNLLSQSVCQTGVLRVQQAHQQIGQLPHTLLQAVNGRYQQELWRVNQSQHSVRRYAAWRLDHQYREKSALAHRLTVAVPFALKNAHQRMESLERSVHLVDPINVMRRGFAMIRRGDAVLTRSSQLVIGESLQIRFADGSAEAIINHTQSDTND